MQKWIQSVLMLQILLAKCQICPQNDISLMPCSSDHMSLSSQLISVSSGTCVSGNCRCNDDFDGAACQFANRADARNIIFKSWIYIAKTCWPAGAKGSLDISISFSPWSCDGECSPSNDLSVTHLPNLLLYPSYDDKFSKAVLNSYKSTMLGQNDDADPNALCAGNAAMYSELLTCSDSIKTDNSSILCKFQKSLSLTNPGTKNTVLYIAIGGCGLVGVFDWAVQVSALSPTVASMCGARGTLPGRRCYSDSAISCALQESSQILTKIQPPAKLSRAEEAVIAVLFVVAFIVAGVMIKVYQVPRCMCINPSPVFVDKCIPAFQC
mmetsp:Transcript_12509/g.34399  ORF Transcript_12509/g.34399 Transcript_12509/m.34399 type:complete len:324 (-) Transcript_12509:950-1921(-)